MPVREAQRCVRLGKLSSDRVIPVPFSPYPANAMQTIYLDHNATTPLRPEVLEAMLPYLKTHYGNPSSVHWAGRQAKHGLEEARERVATLINARSAEVLFTSGGTESNNLALRGVLWAVRGKGMHLITTAIEHSSILGPLRILAGEGFTATILPVDNEGRISAQSLTAALRPETVLVSVSLANHEIGTIQPIAALSRVTRERGILLHVDAVQAA